MLIVDSKGSFVSAFEVLVSMELKPRFGQNT